MEMFDTEREKAKQDLVAKGLDPQAFTFERTYLPPDSDDGAMFTVRYEVRVTRVETGRTLVTTGGIGLDWVDDFADALDEKYFS